MAASGCEFGGFNRSTQQLDGVVQPVYRSLVCCDGGRVAAARHRGWAKTMIAS
ncbi:hypothetical protein D3C72_1919050 [compost metagenome]|jgi:hypothetical protein